MDALEGIKRFSSESGCKTLGDPGDVQWFNGESVSSIWIFWRY